ncbi:MAG: MotA/TolQ/ExbB proton channel family protein [Oscillospiraceae bacterium]|nr:MotA/TolQ/ExbB proton channel family protein [Oscillospiraceae bacterium]
MGLGILSLAAILFSLAVIVFGIMFLADFDMGLVGGFADLPSILLVIAPTFGSLITTVPIQQIAKIPAHFKVIVRKEQTPEAQIEKIVDLANKVRSGGILALEEEQIPEPTMQYGVRMIVDGIQEEKIKKALEDSLDSIDTRHGEVVSMYEKAGSFAPAFGMVGTVVGLIIMLGSMDFDQEGAIANLTAAMAAALITTLYGCILANVIFLPIAARLKILHQREMFNKTLICTGVMALQHGSSPSFIYELLCEQLNKERRKNVTNPRGNRGGD